MAARRANAIAVLLSLIGLGSLPASAEQTVTADGRDDESGSLTKDSPAFTIAGAQAWAEE